MSLLELLALVRKHLVFIIVFTLAVFAATCVYAFYLPNTYTATTTMYVLTRDVSSDIQQMGQTGVEQQSDGSTPVSQVDITYSGLIGDEVSALMNSERARQEVAERLGLANLSEFTISNIDSDNSRIITIAVSGPDPQQVADVANATVEVAADIANTIMNVEAINVIDTAVPPTTPSGPNRLQYILVGLMAGLAGAIFLIYIGNELDTRVHSSQDVEEMVDLPIIGHFPTADNDDSVTSNAAKALLANIRFMGVDNPIRTIALTSAAPDEGKTFVASRLARAIATSGKTVLLVEGDMRRRSLCTTLGVHSDKGVYAVLSGELGLREAVLTTKVPNLYFLDCETQIPTPSDIINSQRYSRLIEYAKAMFDYVVFDTPPLGAFVDAAVLGAKVDTILLVVRENATRKPDIRTAVDQLGKSGSNIGGIVMNYCETGTGGYYSYYYYGYYYGRDGKAKKKGGLFNRSARRDAREFGGAAGAVGGLRGYLDGRAASNAMSPASGSVSGNVYIPQASEYYSSSRGRGSADSGTPVIPMGPQVASAPTTPSQVATIHNAATMTPATSSDGDLFGAAMPAASASVLSSPQIATGTSSTSAGNSHSRGVSAGLTTNFADLAEQIAQSQFRRTAQEGQAPANPMGKHSQRSSAPTRLAQQVYDGEVDEI